jgi:uncharacterized protein with LGFP repeats
MRTPGPRHALILMTALVAGVLAPIAPAFATEVAPPETVHLVVEELPVAATDGEVERSAAVDAEVPFSLLGLTLPDGVESAEVRTRDLDGVWSAWTELDVELPGLDGPDLGSEEAANAAANVTEPLWVGGADAFQVRIDGELTDVEATLIDTEGHSEGRIAKLARHLTPKVVTQPAEANPAAPTIITRKQWGADESLRKGKPSYATPRFTVIHHTAGSNSYTKAQSASIMRGMYTYHTRSNGWADLGYNLVVDKYGQVFEGRFGGVTEGVIGAHAANFNTGSIGVAVIGNYDTVDIPSVALQRVADVVAWKYGIHRIDATASRTVTANGRTLNTTTAHRNVGSTACPGRYFYAKMGSLRTMIASRAATSKATVPGAPTAAKATAGNAGATVTWTAPSSNGGSAITGYTVTASPGGRTATTNGSGRTATVTGLTVGTAYTFTVRATNSVGRSAASSPTASVTPFGVPTAPRSVTATAHPGAATVTWRAPSTANGSRITSYTVTASPGGHRATFDRSLRTGTITGLTNGTAYTFTVRATNAAGASPASSPSAAVTPRRSAPPPASQTPRPTVGQPIPVVGDWNGDGRSQVGWFHNGWWNLPTGRNNTTVRFQYGGRNDLPVVGDWNGNGRDGIGTVRDGTWRLRQTPTAGTPTLTFTYGRPTDLPVAGDFNGNGRDGIGVYRNGRWLLRQTATAGTATLAFTYGTANDRPIVGDFNANGRDGIGTVTDATWRLRHTATAGTPQLTFAYGRPTDWPQTGDFNRNRQHTPLVVRADKWLISNHLPTRPADITLTYSPTATQLR